MEEKAMMKELVAQISLIPEVESVEADDDCIIVHGPYDGYPSESPHIVSLIEKITKAYNKEPCGWGWLYRFERVKEWENANPAPTNPKNTIPRKPKAY